MRRPCRDLRPLGTQSVRPFLLRECSWPRQIFQPTSPLDPALFEIKEIALTGPLKTYFTTAEGLEFSNVIKAIPAGKPLRAADLRSAVLIERGQPVVLAMERVPGLNISIKMTALEDGRFGEQIKLRNMESGKTTTGLVSGWAQVSMR